MLLEKKSQQNKTTKQPTTSISDFQLIIFHVRMNLTCSKKNAMLLQYL